VRARVLVCATDEEEEKVRALDAYIVKPFAPRELVARLSAVLRRARCVDRFAGEGRRAA